MKAKILLVEDDWRVRDAMAALLAAWDYEVEVATNGVEALEKVGAFNPALVVSDVRMPRMGAIELISRLRPKVPGVPFILYSGMGIDPSETANLDSVIFLPKPLNPGELKSEIEKLLNRAA